MRRHIRYRRGKLIRPANESSYLNILPLIRAGTHVTTRLRLVPPRPRRLLDLCLTILIRRVRDGLRGTSDARAQWAMIAD